MLIFGFFCVVHSSSGQDSLVRGREALDSGNPTSAISILESFRRQHPSNPAVYNLLGIAYARTHEDEKALAMFQNYARLAPDQPEAYNNLGASYLRAGDASQAEKAFRRALALRPRDVDGLYNLGALLNARHEYAAAQPLLERALRQSRATDIIYQTAVASAGVGDREEALQLLNSENPPPGQQGFPWIRLLATLELDVGRLPAAAAACQKALALQPDDAVVLYSLAMVHLRLKQPSQAVALLERSMAPLPANTRHFRIAALLAKYGASAEAISELALAVQDNPSSYESWYDLAILEFQRKKDLQAARQAGERALSIKSTGQVHDLLGDVCESQGSFRDALNHYQEAVRLDPGEDKFIFDLGVELIIHQNYQAAQQIFQAGSARFPKSARIYLGLGAAQFMDDKNAQAVDAFLKAVDLDPGFDPAYMFLGEASILSGVRTPEVVAKLSELAQKEPNSFGAQYYYGAALVMSIDHTKNLALADEALRHLNRAAQLQPQSANTYYEVGEIARLRNQVALSAKLYEKAIALSPSDPEALYKLGQAYVRMGRREDAVKCFTRQREAASQRKEELYRRSQKIETFILQIRDANRNGI